MENELVIASPADRVQAFLNEMLEWELWFDKADREQQRNADRDFKEGKVTPEQIGIESEQLRAKSRAWLQNILVKYLTEKAMQKIGMNKLYGMMTARPPYYKQEIVEFEQKVKLATVFTERDSPTFHYFKYILRIEEGSWKIDSVYGKTHHQEDKWSKHASI